jgi:hypothetical protein
LEAVIKPSRNTPMSNVQWKIPDDGQRKSPKHVEFFDKIKFGKFVGLVGFIKKKFVTMHGHMNVKLPLHLVTVFKEVEEVHLSSNKISCPTTEKQPCFQ